MLSQRAPTGPATTTALHGHLLALCPVSSVPIPGTKQRTWQQPGLSAWGREVDVLLPGPGKGETLLGSEGGLVPLRVVADQAAFFSTIGACQLTATSLVAIVGGVPLRNDGRLVL